MSLQQCPRCAKRPMGTGTSIQQPPGVTYVWQNWPLNEPPPAEAMCFAFSCLCWACKRAVIQQLTRVASSILNTPPGWVTEVRQGPPGGIAAESPAVAP